MEFVNPKPGDMDIKIRMLTGRSLIFSLNENDTIYHILELIQKAEGFPIHSYPPLIYKGRRLSDDKSTIKAAGIRPDEVLHMVLCIRGG